MSSGVSCDADIRDLVAANPWAEHIRLTWLWHFRAEVELTTPYSVDDYAVMVADGWTFDPEYSYWGHVARLGEYLDAYGEDVWYGVDLGRCEVTPKPSARSIEVVYRCPRNDGRVLAELPVPDEDGNDVIESMTSRITFRRGRR